MGDFMNALERTVNNEKAFTENGAVGYRTTGKNLLDLNFAVSSLRNSSSEEISSRFERAFFDDKLTAIKWLFYARDVRGGLGERRLFRVILKHMMSRFPNYFVDLLPLVPEYGRWDDLWVLLDTEYRSFVGDIVAAQLDDDIRNANTGKSISLLAKWMPRSRSSSKTSWRYAQILQEELDMKIDQYQHVVSGLSRRLNVVEQKMSAKKWDEIDYQGVPSRANLIYSKAFLRHDAARRIAFLEDVNAGRAKINSGTLFPHDIVHKYAEAYGFDVALEALWNGLPNTINDYDSTIVVADGSGSMRRHMGNTQITALEIANALAIYFAERCKGEFKDRYITFSEHPQLVNLGSGNSLYEKLCVAKFYTEVANTNIEAVFELILTTAIQNRMRQDELPKNILIISDMEFDSCAVVNGAYFQERPTATLFENISSQYNAAGYQIPRLAFWNVCSRTNVIPIKENDLGVALVSGFSPNVAKMVMSNTLDPYECLLGAINVERYQPIEDRLKSVI